MLMLHILRIDGDFRPTTRKLQVGLALALRPSFEHLEEHLDALVVHVHLRDCLHLLGRNLFGADDTLLKLLSGDHDERAKRNNVLEALSQPFHLFIRLICSCLQHKLDKLS
jgi:hypothetical protein